MSDSQNNVLNVINPAEGRRYKITLRGDISNLPSRKLKKYLVASSGIEAAGQQLKYNGVELGDEVLCGEVGISSGSTLTVERKPHDTAPYVASPTKAALELETLDQQRELLARERSRREEAFKKQKDALHSSLALAEQRRNELQREKSEKEQELQRLQSLEEQAASESARLEEVRKAEAEREGLRARDLEARKEQLSHERMQQRQLEMMRLENERKKMLLEQQRAEYQGERTRLERERKERQERIKKQELMIREKEVELERNAVDAERQRRQLLQEREVLEQQRHAEMEHYSLVPPQSGNVSQQHLLHSSAVAGGTTPRHPSTPRAGTNGMMATPRNATTTRMPSGSDVSAVSAKSQELAALRREKEELLLRQSQMQEQQRDAEDDEEAQLEQEIARERAEIEAIRSGKTPTLSRHPSQMSSTAQPQLHHHQQQQQSSGAIPPLTPPRGSAIDTETPQHQGGDAITEDNLRALAADQLQALADDLGVASLALDDNNTCVVSIEDRYTLLITFDPSTQRVYLYSTLSTFIPKSPETKLRLYEFLLEGALLGRDMCGGGVGVSLKNDFILLSTSVFLPRSSRSALRTVTPTFVETLVKWRTQVRELLADDGASGVFTASTAGQHQQTMQQHQQSQSLGGTTQGGRFHSVRSNANHSSVAHGASTSVNRASIPSAFIPEDTFDESANGAAAASATPVIGIEVTEGDDARGIIVLKARGPAARAGMLPNDVIRKVDGSLINSLGDFQAAVRRLKPNSAAPFVVERARTQLLVNVLVGSSASRQNEPRYGVVQHVAAAGVADGGSLHRPRAGAMSHSSTHA